MTGSPGVDMGGLQHFVLGGCGVATVCRGRHSTSSEPPATKAAIGKPVGKLETGTGGTGAGARFGGEGSDEKTMLDESKPT